MKIIIDLSLDLSQIENSNHDEKNWYALTRNLQICFISFSFRAQQIWGKECSEQDLGWKEGNGIDTSKEQGVGTTADDGDRVIIAEEGAHSGLPARLQAPEP